MASNGDDHPEAAGKHLNDASTLAAAGRYDGAAYLSGYVAECCLKTLIIVAKIGTHGLGAATQQASGLKHNLSKLSLKALELAALPNSVTAPYSFLPAAVPIGWRPEMRYRAPIIAKDDAVKWVSEVRSLYESTVARLRLDGVVK